MLFASGVAQIIVEDSGQNSIVIVAGANDHLSPEDVEKSRDLLSKAKVMLCVLEIPRETALAGLRLANELNGKFLRSLNVVSRMIMNGNFVPQFLRYSMLRRLSRI